MDVIGKRWVPAAHGLLAAFALWGGPGIAAQAAESIGDIQARWTHLAASKEPDTVAASSSQQHGMPADIAAALREIGPKIDGPRTAALYAPLQPVEPYSGVTVTRDLHYGPHERHVLDVFAGEHVS